MTRERIPFDFTDHYAQITGLELTEEQLEEVGVRQAETREEHDLPSEEKKENEPPRKKQQTDRALDV